MTDPRSPVVRIEYEFADGRTLRAVGDDVLYTTTFYPTRAAAIKDAETEARRLGIKIVTGVIF